MARWQWNETKNVAHAQPWSKDSNILKLYSMWVSLIRPSSNPIGVYWSQVIAWTAGVLCEAVKCANHKRSICENHCEISPDQFFPTGMKSSEHNLLESLKLLAPFFKENSKPSWWTHPFFKNSIFNYVIICTSYFTPEAKKDPQKTRSKWK